MTRTRISLALLLALGLANPALAYIEVPMTLGAVIQQSTCICSMVVTKVDRTQNLIIFEKLQDLKGKHPQQTIKHNIGKNGLRPGEWKEIMDWAEVGKTAVFFHNGSSSETFIGVTWYQAYPNGEWWGMSHGEPFLLRSFAGKQEKLALAVKEIVDGKEIVVSCMVDGDKEALHKKSAKIQRVRASMKLLDYNPKRDFVGWGGEDIRRIAGLGGFDRVASLGATGPDARAATAVDLDHDGRPDLCLISANKVSLLLSADDGFNEISLPGFTGGARAASWADYNADGLVDLLLATPTGPRLFTNLGKGIFKETSSMLPKERAYNLTGAAWGDFNHDGKPDILLANGFHGLRLYLNKRPDDAGKTLASATLSPWHALGPFRFGPDGTKNHEHAFAPELEPGNAVNLTTKHKGKRDMEITWAKKEYGEAAVSSLGEFGQNCAVYLAREIDVKEACDYPLSLGSSGALTVWLNGSKIHTENTRRTCEADQVLLNVKLKAGKNHLLVKCCNLDQEHQVYFASGLSAFKGIGWFVDASEEFGLGESGLGAETKSDGLIVADLDHDGKLDVLLAAETPLLLTLRGQRFTAITDHNLRFVSARFGPILGDYDQDGLLDLFVPAGTAGHTLLRNKGKFQFEEVPLTALGLSQPLGHVTSAAWGDINNDGKLDLLVTLLRGTNRAFQNNGNGTFTDISDRLGINQKIHNTQAACWADLNKDGALDLVLNNEGQDSVVYFGVAKPAKLTPVLLKGTVSAREVTILNQQGQRLTSSQVGTTEGRGAQSGLNPRFVLVPGQYRLHIISQDGKAREKPFTVEASPLLLDPSQ